MGSITFMLGRVRNLCPLFIGAGLLCAAAQAQQTQGSQDRTPAFQLKTQLSQKERDLFWKNTTVSKEGYLRITGTNDQVNIIEEARALPFLKFEIDPALGSAASAIRAAGFPFVGTWKEDPTRTTMIFGDSKHGYLMYTAFNYEKAHAKVSVPSEFARFKVKGSPAVLSLTVNPNSTKGLWKLVFWRSGTAHEIYLTEKMPTSIALSNNQKVILNIGDALAN